ncbi:MAG: GTPase Era [Hyphomicrobiaceae bacterium]
MAGQKDEDDPKSLGIGEPGSDAPASEQRRCGFISVIGAPNAGKSTLVNALVGTKVAIVSRKVQTTRVPVRGIAMVGQSQLVFIDTPGIFKPRRHLDRAMVEAAWGGAGEGDLCVVLIDAQKGITQDVERILKKLKDVKPAKWLVLNKVDKLEDKAQLLALATKINAYSEFEEVFMISALTGSGLETIKNALGARVPPGPWHFAEDDVSDMPMRILAAEITRETIYERLHQELPYAITVETTDWKDFKNGSARIEQTIYVERESQKVIVLGEKGTTIKKLSSDSRKQLAALIDRPVHLFLFVKVRENWGRDPERYREMGLSFPKE